MSKKTYKKQKKSVIARKSRGGMKKTHKSDGDIPDLISDTSDAAIVMASSRGNSLVPIPSHKHFSKSMEGYPKIEYGDVAIIGKDGKVKYSPFPISRSKLSKEKTPGFVLEEGSIVKGDDSPNVYEKILVPKETPNAISIPGHEFILKKKPRHTIKNVDKFEIFNSGKARGEENELYDKYRGRYLSDLTDNSSDDSNPYANKKKLEKMDSFEELGLDFEKQQFYDIPGDSSNNTRNKTGILKDHLNSLDDQKNYMSDPEIERRQIQTNKPLLKTRRNKLNPILKKRRESLTKSKKGGTFKMKKFIHLGPKETEDHKQREYYRDIRNNVENELGQICYKARELQEKLDNDVKNGVIQKQIRDPNQSRLKNITHLRGRDLVDNPIYLDKKNDIEKQLRKCNQKKEEFTKYDNLFWQYDAKVKAK